MIYVPVTIFRLFTSLYILAVPGLGSPTTAPVIRSQFTPDYAKQPALSTSMGYSRVDKFGASCDLLPNFRCASGDYCIPVKLVLNGYKDCEDGSDEDARKINFCDLGPSIHRCAPNSKCITSQFGYRCQCLDGYTGDGFYCERFPMGIQITVSTNDTLEDVPVSFNVSILVFPNGPNSNLSLTIVGLPANAKFSVGAPCNETAWCFTEDDFSFGTYVNTEFFPPRDFSGVIPLNVIAEIYRDGYWVTGYSATALQVIPVPDAPYLRVGTVCYASEETAEIIIPVNARLSDTDGSEELEIDFDGLPDGFDISTWTDQADDVVNVDTANMPAENTITTLVIKPLGELNPFNATISAVAREKANGKENVTAKNIMIAKCPPKPNMSVIFDVPEHDILEGHPIPLRITVKFDLEESPRLISIQLTNFTQGASLNRGRRVGSSWVLSRQDLSAEDLFLTPPQYFSGELTLHAQSEALYRGFLYNLDSDASIKITPVATTPLLHAYPEVICLTGANTTNVSFVIDAALVDVDGSEHLVIQYNIPEDWMGSAGTSFHGSYSLITALPHETLNVTVSTTSGFLYPTEVPVVVIAIEKENADQKIVFQKVKLMSCDAAMYKQSLLRQRTTLIWNVTTPASLNSQLPINFGINTSSSTSIFSPVGNITNFTDNSFPEGAASELDLVQEGVDSAQDDESVPVRSNRNFSFLEITTSTPSTTTRNPLKVQRLAKTTEEKTVRPQRTRPSKRRKPKGPQVPGRAQMDHVKLEQYATIANGTEDVPIGVNITVITKNAPVHSAVQTRIFGLPHGSFMTRGTLENLTHAWLLNQRDLAQTLTLYLPRHLSGKFSLTVASSLNLPRNKTLVARENVDLRVRPETDSGQFEITSPYFSSKCFQLNDKRLRFTVRVKLEDNDGSEEVEYLELRGLPKHARVEPGRILNNDEAYLIFGRELPTFDIITDRNFPQFDMTLDAKIREKATGVKTSVVKQIPIVPCSGASQTGDLRRFGWTKRLRSSLLFLISLLSAVIIQKLIC
ncbi:uncharacterized protein LOC129586190 [Paramacrobiotus metropolitanus]|uniref:uncharacterized protein LOC129586190 n=1 Tax=Paramacrobiotus metropolitanus TaxID=2943436 RepID=UPI002445AE1F|nr:uncharacterized protein LOC129586190 [Paramacrobiotus metropolitanus]